MHMEGFNLIPPVGFMFDTTLAFAHIIFSGFLDKYRNLKLIAAHGGAAGIDLFMGFVLGPILRRLDLPARREIMRRLTPRTLFLMPTVSIISNTSGWFLAVKLGYTGLEWPAYGWIAAALVLVTLMTIQGLGFLTPVNVFVCLELQKGNPNMTKVSGWMQRYFYVVALQGVMQVAIIVVMTRFRVGI